MLNKTRKRLAVQITLGLTASLAAGFSCNTGLAADQIGSYEDLLVKPNVVDEQYLYHGEGRHTADLSSVVLEKNDSKTVYGVFSCDKAVVDAFSDNINVAVTNNNGAAYAVSAGVFNDSKGNLIHGGTINLGDEDTKDINIKVAAQGDATGLSAIRSINNSQVEPCFINVKGENINIEAHSAGGYATGIWVQNNTTVSGENNSAVTIDAANTYIKVTSDNNNKVNGECNNIGIVNYSGGKVSINGNLTVDAGTFLSTRGSATTEINKDGTGTVKINGDINFNYDEPTSGTSVDAVVDINLNNKESVFNGNIFVNGNPYPPDGKKDVGGMTLGVSNGATWNTDASSFVNTLDFNDGIINVNGGAAQEVQIGSLQGSGGTVNMKTSADLAAGKLKIGMDGSEGPTNAKLAVNFTGITADDLEGQVNALNTLAGHVSVSGNEGLKATANVAEGLLKGAVSAEMEKTADGGSSSMTINNATVKQSQESSTMTSMRNVASVAIVSWRQEDSTLGQRLGELRSSAGDQGIWARMNRGEFEYSGAYKNQYNFFQLGYDKAFGSWHYGAAVSHNDGKTTYDNGKGENKSTSLSLYGTWLGDKGHYADIVLKQGRLSNEYDNYAAAGHTHGDYNAWGTSLSGEYGMKVGLDNGWYVTPQAQLTLMRIGGEDYTTNNGIHVSQDTLKSCVGRIGFEAGKAVGSKGSIYAKASLLHEFAGNADTYLSLNGISNSYSQDIGGTWYEAGLGFNFKTTANSYVYADVVKTFGDDLKTPWQWNVGARWTF